MGRNDGRAEFRPRIQRYKQYERSRMKRDEEDPGEDNIGQHRWRDVYQRWFLMVYLFIQRTAIFNEIPEMRRGNLQHEPFYVYPRAYSSCGVLYSTGTLFVNVSLADPPLLLNIRLIHCCRSISCNRILTLICINDVGMRIKGSRYLGIGQSSAKELLGRSFENKPDLYHRAKKPNIVFLPAV